MGKKDSVAAASSDAFKKVDLPINDPRTLVLALRAPEPEVCGRACEALEKFAQASERNRLDLLAAGVLEALMPLLRAGEAEATVRHQASLCMSTLTEQLKVRQALRSMREPSPLDMFLALLAPEEHPVAHENGCSILANLAQDFSTRVELMRRGALPAVAALLESPSHDVQKYAAKTFLLMMDEYDARQAVTTLPTALDALVALLGSDYPELQQLALACLGRAARNQSNRTAIREKGGLERLIHFVSNAEFQASHPKALQALSEMLHDPTCMARLSESGPAGKDGISPPPPVATLLSFLKPSSVEVQVQAALCVARAAGNENNRRHLLDNKAEAALLAQFVPEDPKANLDQRVAAAACYAIASLSEGLSNSEAFGRQQGVAKIVKFLHSDSTDCVARALEALAALCAHVIPNRMAMAEEGLPRVVELLASPTPAVQAGAAMVMAALCKTPTLQATLIEANTTPALVAAMSSSDVRVQAASCAAIAELAKTQSTCALIADLDGLGPLVSLAESPEAAVRQSAMRAIRSCALDPEIARRLCDNGALESLTAIANSLSMSSAFVTAAYEQLLTSNLSAKLAVTGTLGLSDRIRTLFYDVGRLPRGAALPSLTELMVQPVNNQRAVLLVDLDPTHVPAPAMPTKVGGTGSARQPAKSAKRDKSAAPQEPAAATATASTAADGSEAEAVREPRFDADLSAFVESSAEKLDALQAADISAPILARLVAERMGGSVRVEELPRFSHEMATAELKLALGSNVLPLGKVRRGTYYHRALLFKVVADAVGLASELVGGSYGLAFNVVHLADGGMRVVDVMHEPGRLLVLEDKRDLHLPANFFAEAPEQPGQ